MSEHFSPLPLPEHTTWYLDAHVSLLGHKRITFEQVVRLDDIAAMFPMRAGFTTRHDTPAYVFQFKTDSVYSCSKYKTIFSPTSIRRTLLRDTEAQYDDVKNDVLDYLTLVAPGLRSVPEMVGGGLAMFQNSRVSPYIRPHISFCTKPDLPIPNLSAVAAFAREHSEWEFTVYEMPLIAKVKP